MPKKNVNVEEVLRQLIIKATKRDIPVLHKEHTFKDLGVDSMEVVQILVSLEDKLNIDINDKDLKDIRNMGAFIEYLNNKVAEKTQISDKNKPY